MRIDFPDHALGRWQRTPAWMFWRPPFRRKHWRWTVDHKGCECQFYWQYANYRRTCVTEFMKSKVT